MNKKHINNGKEVDTELLFKSFNNLATAEEEARICEWLKANDENKKKYLDARGLHEAFLMDAPIELFENRMPESAVKRRSAVKYMLLGLGNAAVVALFCILGLNLISDRYEERFADTMNTISVPAGQRLDYTLSDGTVIKLNAGARLQYPMAFAGDRREVHLEGEAYFDVAHNEKQPFVVKTFASDIEVLGTEFNVNADKEAGAFTTSLIEGSVRLSSSLIPGGHIVMHPNEKVTLVKNQMILKKYDASRDIRWMEGVLDIGGLDFGMLMKKLEMAFGVRIIVECEVPSGQVFANAKIRVSDGIDNAFEVIANGADFTYSRDRMNGTIYIR